MSNNVSPFRRWLQPDHPRFAGMVHDSAASWTEKLMNIPAVQGMVGNWNRLWQEPFLGVTTDGIFYNEDMPFKLSLITSTGKVIPYLYFERDDEIPIDSIVEAGNAIISLLSEDQKSRVLLAIDAHERRAWSNPELYVHRFGIRLEEVDEKTRAAVLRLFEVTLSPEGYQKAISAMRINHFLGELVNGRGVLNEHSYNFVLFGTPSKTEPWGWVLYGHHLDLSVFVKRTHIVLTPTFTGAEPNIIDSGPYEGTLIMTPEEELGWQFMWELPPKLQKKAQIYEHLAPPQLPEWRYHFADQRHICGAFQDNRILPYEGVNLSELDEKFTELLLRIVEQFILYLPEQARKNRLAEVKRHSKETYFCWIGKCGKEDPFYYRIQSPVIICEFDHHSGVFLLNKEPARFHIHSIVRSPNGGDYGYALLK